ncbi:hypothetical protein HDU96_001470 [Phlyctochytrium bullatum]|nr:hypothetical protein HDU96_001470 [Phlyctochytrium bullatum]
MSACPDMTDSATTAAWGSDKSALRRLRLTSTQQRASTDVTDSPDATATITADGLAVKELALAVLLHLHTTDVANILLVNRRIRTLFMLSPDQYRIALKHLQRHAELHDQSDIDEDYYDVADRHATIPFPRLPLAYALAYVSWKYLDERAVVVIFPDRADENDNMSLPRPLLYPQRIEKFLRKTIELDFDIAIDIRNSVDFWLRQELDGVDMDPDDENEWLGQSVGFSLAAQLEAPTSVELTHRLIVEIKVLRSAKSAEERATLLALLERAAMRAACLTGSVAVAE